MAPVRSVVKVALRDLMVFRACLACLACLEPAHLAVTVAPARSAVKVALRDNWAAVGLLAHLGKARSVVFLVVRPSVAIQGKMGLTATQVKVVVQDRVGS